MLPTIFIIGPPASGRSTLAQNLSSKINFVHVEMMDEMLKWQAQHHSEQALNSSSTATAKQHEQLLSDFSPEACVAAIENVKQQILANNLIATTRQPSPGQLHPVPNNRSSIASSSSGTLTNNSSNNNNKVNSNNSNSASIGATSSSSSHQQQQAQQQQGQGWAGDGMILDGFPATVSQLEEFLKFNPPPLVVFYLLTPIDVIKARAIVEGNDEAKMSLEKFLVPAPTPVGTAASASPKPPMPPPQQQPPSSTRSRPATSSSLPSANNYNRKNSNRKSEAAASVDEAPTPKFLLSKVVEYYSLGYSSPTPPPSSPSPSQQQQQKQQKGNKASLLQRSQMQQQRQRQHHPEFCCLDGRLSRTDLFLAADSFLHQPNSMYQLFSMAMSLARGSAVVGAHVASSGVFASFSSGSIATPPFSRTASNLGVMNNSSNSNFKNNTDNSSSSAASNQQQQKKATIAAASSARPSSSSSPPFFSPNTGIQAKPSAVRTSWTSRASSQSTVGTRKESDSALSSSGATKETSNPSSSSGGSPIGSIHNSPHVPSSPGKKASFQQPRDQPGAQPQGDADDDVDGFSDRLSGIDQMMIRKTGLAVQNLQTLSSPSNNPRAKMMTMIANKNNGTTLASSSAVLSSLERNDESTVGGAATTTSSSSTKGSRKSSAAGTSHQQREVAFTFPTSSPSQTLFALSSEQHQQHLRGDAVGVPAAAAAAGVTAAAGARGGGGGGDGNDNNNCDDDAAEAHMTMLIANEKQRAQKARQRRIDYFASVSEFSTTLEKVYHKDVRCGWLGCAALALSFVSEQDVSVEDILRYNRMSLHYVSLSAVTTAELCDTVDEFIQLRFQQHFVQRTTKKSEIDGASKSSRKVSYGVGGESAALSAGSPFSSRWFSAAVASSPPFASSSSATSAKRHFSASIRTSDSTCQQKASSSSLSNSTRNNNNNVIVKAELIMFDSDLVHEDDEDPQVAKNTEILAAKVGERPPIRSLAEFRKFVASELTNSHSMLAVNFDPFLIQVHLEQTEMNTKTSMAAMTKSTTANEDGDWGEDFLDGSYSSTQKYHENRSTTITTNSTTTAIPSLSSPSTNKNQQPQHQQRQQREISETFANTTATRNSSNSNSNGNSNNNNNNRINQSQYQSTIHSSASTARNENQQRPNQHQQQQEQREPWTAKNQGAFGLLVRYSEVKQSVVIGLPYFHYDDEREHEIGQHQALVSGSRKRSSSTTGALGNAFPFIAAPSPPSVSSASPSVAAATPKRVSDATTAPFADNGSNQPQQQPSSNFKLHTIECPLQVLYDSICVVDSYTRRRRGLVRIYVPLPQGLMTPHQNLEQLMRRRRSSTEVAGWSAAFSSQHHHQYENQSSQQQQHQQQQQQKVHRVQQQQLLIIPTLAGSVSLLASSLNEAHKAAGVATLPSSPIYDASRTTMTATTATAATTTTGTSNSNNNNNRTNVSDAATNASAGEASLGSNEKKFVNSDSSSNSDSDCFVNYSVPSCFPLHVIDGRNSNGMLSVSLDVTISPHILGLSLLHHLVQSTFLQMYPLHTWYYYYYFLSNNNVDSNDAATVSPVTTSSSSQQQHQQQLIPSQHYGNNFAISSNNNNYSNGTSSSNSNYNYNSYNTNGKSSREEALRGIPVTDICQTLELPIGVITSKDCNSLEIATSWYNEYLKRKRLDGGVRVGLVRIQRRGNTEDGAVNVTEDEVAEIFSAAVLVDIRSSASASTNEPEGPCAIPQQQQQQQHQCSPLDIQSVILVNFDINIALNTVVTTTSSGSGNSATRSPDNEQTASNTNIIVSPRKSSNKLSSPTAAVDASSSAASASASTTTTAMAAATAAAAATNTHFAVVVGYDPKTTIVKLADVNVKKFRKVWHTTLPRLHEAMIGCGGFLIAASVAAHGNLHAFVSTNSISTTSNSNNMTTTITHSASSPFLPRSPSLSSHKQQQHQLQHQAQAQAQAQRVSPLASAPPSFPSPLHRDSGAVAAATLAESLFSNPVITAAFQRASKLASSAVRFALPPNPREFAIAPRFEFPKRNFSATPLATALCSLGIRTTVEDLLYGSGYDVSFMLSEHLPLLCLESIVSYFCFHRRDNVAHVSAFVLDQSVTFSDDDFIASVKASVKCDSCKRIVVNFHPASLQRRGDAWNGSVCANTALVVGYDDTTRRVILEDSNPEVFYRTWACPVPVLMQLMREEDSNSCRPRGFLEIVRGPDASRDGTNGADLRRSMQHHPFKTTVSSVACSIALAVSELSQSTAYSAEDVYYAAASFLSLATLSQQLVMDQVVELADQFISSDPFLRATVKVEAVRRAQWTKMPVAEYSSLLTVPHSIVVLIYKPAVIFPRIEQSVTTLGGGIVTKVEAGRIHIVDGDLTKRGRTWNKLVERVLRGTAGVLVFQRRR